MSACFQDVTPPRTITSRIPAVACPPLPCHVLRYPPWFFQGVFLEHGRFQICGIAMPLIARAREWPYLSVSAATAPRPTDNSDLAMPLTARGRERPSPSGYVGPICRPTSGLRPPPRVSVLSVGLGAAGPLQLLPAERDFFIDSLLVRTHFITVMIRWTGLAPRERCFISCSDFSRPALRHGSLNSCSLQ